MNLRDDDPPPSGVVALHHLATKLHGRPSADPAPASGVEQRLPSEPRAKTLPLGPSRLSEEDLRQLIGNLAKAGGSALAFVLAGPRAELEPVTNLAELFWKLVERRVFGAVFVYERGGRQVQDRVVSTPGGFSLEREVQE